MSHLNPATTVDSPAGSVVLTEPLDAEAFAPFGGVIDASGFATTFSQAIVEVEPGGGSDSPEPGAHVQCVHLLYKDVNRIAALPIPSAPAPA